jgi:tetratricopeptide (TPR) repeat protein
MGANETDRPGSDDHPPADPAAAASSTGLTRGESVGRYVVLDRLGAGGMAVVYAAYDPDLDRKVALKLMRPDETGSGADAEGRVRLLREGQALARLAHPNVVGVHDVGTYRDQVFVAMELVEGETLRSRLQAKPLGWRAVLDLFVPAGHGLAAAHHAGLIHRDFKPDNVLLGKDGSIRVADFGLARTEKTDLVDVAPAVERDQPRTSAISRSGPVLSSKLTQAGTMLGTPAYMSPEQYRGRAADARSDQFSFCVALYEALYGELPFVGATMMALAVSVTQGKVRPAPKGTRIPPWLRSALLRGLAVDPDGRFPSMNALLAELTRDRRAARRRIAVGFVAVLAAGATLFGYLWWQRAAAEACAGVERELDGVWDAAVQQRIHAAFLATGKPYAAGTWERVQRTLDGYARTWLAARRRSCAETGPGGGAAPGQSDKREACLVQRMQQLKALTQLLGQADAPMVERAATAAQGLAAVDDCTDPARLAVAVPLPADASTRARVQALRAREAQGWALHDLYRFDTAIALATPLVAEAKQAGFKPVEAEALHLLGAVQARATQNQAAAATLTDAAFAAAAAHYDAVEAQAAIQLILVVGNSLAQADIGMLWVRQADALIERTGGAAAPRWQLLRAIGYLRYGLGDYDGAIARWIEALGLLERSGTPNKSDLAELLADIAGGYEQIMSFEKALPYRERSTAILRKALGDDHPRVAVALADLGWMLGILGRSTEAFRLFDQATGIVERAFGPDSALLEKILPSHANIRMAVGDYDRAIELMERTLALLAKYPETSLPTVLGWLDLLGGVYRRKGDPQRALEIHQDVFRRASEAFGPGHLQVNLAIYYMARDLSSLGRYTEAAEMQRRTITPEGTMVDGVEHPWTGYAYTSLGEALLGAGDLAGAIAAYEHSIKRFEEEGIDQIELGWARIGLARALVASGGDRQRARALVIRAQAEFTAMRDRGREGVAAAAKWLRENLSP